MTGSSWSVDIEGTRAVLEALDVDAASFCATASEIDNTGDRVIASLRGSSRVSTAFSAFMAERNTVPVRIVGRAAASSGAVTTSVEAVRFADEEMATASSVAEPAAFFDAGRFAGTGIPR
jgi:hypothetical protein